ncbi:MAG TPA: class I SAM-dependent methyltransferase [Candidatus Limiplasma sp.]|nr:class I SAM-dependent methyltransferase [Candidatus Limiplasma sp.]
MRAWAQYVDFEVTLLYTAFASVYDRLMADVDYQAWAGFYQTLLSLYGLRSGKLCECACGTGGLTLPLAAMGYQMTGVDISEEMLFEASQKARREGAMIPFVRQDMRSLRLHRQMDGVLCTCDGINYLPSPEDVLAFFCAAFAAIRPGGALIFDVSTPYKMECVLGDNFVGDETADIAYLWKNAFNPENTSVEMALSIFTRQEGETYQRISEQQTQYGYSIETFETLLTRAGFADIRIFGDGTFAPPAPSEQRWHIAARKPVPQDADPAE